MAHSKDPHHPARAPSGILWRCGLSRSSTALPTTYADSTLTHAGEGVSDLYAHAVFKQPLAAPVSAETSAGGPVPLSTILFSQVPRPGKPTLAAAPTTAPGGEAAPSSGGSAQ